jgi:nitrite reductase/ring-hydroxylating ferredoxin subunit
VSLKLVAGGAVGRLDVDEATPVIACPWHGWEFELASGCSLADPQYRVAVYPVSVVGDRLMIEIAT